MSIKPLIPEELPESLRKAYNYENQFVEDRYLRIERICLECGKREATAVSSVRSGIKHGTLTGLCRHCSGQKLVRKIHPKLRGKKRIPKIPVYVNCEFCGIAYVKKGGHQKYCSKKCAQRAFVARKAESAPGPRSCEFVVKYLLP